MFYLTMISIWQVLNVVGVPTTWHREAVCHAALVATAASGNGKVRKGLVSRKPGAGRLYATHL